MKTFALDGDVNAFLPFVVRNPAHPEVPVTFRRLLAHTPKIADGALHDPQRNFQPWKPGAQHGYTNVAYGLLSAGITSEIARLVFAV